MLTPPTLSRDTDLYQECANIPNIYILRYFVESSCDTDERADVGSSREFDGKVTHVFSSHGLIDNEVYFSFDKVLGGARPTVNDLVSVHATQQYVGGGWHAEHVTISENWDDDDGCDDNVVNLDRPTEIVGHVTQISGTTGYVGDNVYFDLSDCKCVDFAPCKGDWVKASVTYPEETNFHVVAQELQPLRVKETDGVISGEMGSHGYIDGEVFYMADVVVNGYVPRKWEPVHYVAVESLQGRSSWRAVKVEPSQRPQLAK